MVENREDDALDLPVWGNWDAETLPPPRGREHEPDPGQTDEQLLDLLRSSYDESVMWRRVYPTRHQDPTTSYFGGHPLLHEDIQWPRTLDGRSSLMFVGQIDLSMVPDFSLRSLLPEVGTLYFFFGASQGTPFGRIGRVIADLNARTAGPRTPPSDRSPIWEGYAPSDCEWVDEGRLPAFKYYTEFPRYDVAPVLCRFYQDHHPTHYWGETGKRYQELWKREQSREVLAAFGPPHGRWWPSGPDYYRRPGEPLIPNTVGGKEQPSPETHGIAPRISGEPWLPDEKWPYSWLFVEIAVALLIKGVADSRFGSSALDKLQARVKESEAHANYFARQVERYQSIVAQGLKWLDRARSEDSFDSLSDAERGDFRNWILSVGQPDLYLDPNYRSKESAYMAALTEWSKRGANPREVPKSPTYEGGQDSFWQPTVTKHISTSLMRGVELSLAESARAAARIPQGAMEFFRWRHEPLRDHGSRFVRHQLLGAPRILQPTGMQLAQTHILLMQFDTDEPMHWMWGDMGVLHYWITRKDLNERNFENVVVTIDG